MYGAGLGLKSRPLDQQLDSLLIGLWGQAQYVLSFELRLVKKNKQLLYNIESDGESNQPNFLLIYTIISLEFILKPKMLSSIFKSAILKKKAHV